MIYMAFMGAIGKVEFALRQSSHIFLFSPVQQVRSMGMKISGIMKMYLLIPERASSVI